jgi:hypothetical protein
MRIFLFYMLKESVQLSLLMDQITTKTPNSTNVAFSHKFTCKGTWRHVFICLRPLHANIFVWCGKNNLVGSESGQITQCITPVFVLHTNRSPPPLPQLHTV